MGRENAGSGTRFLESEMRRQGSAVGKRFNLAELPNSESDVGNSEGKGEAWLRSGKRRLRDWACTAKGENQLHSGGVELDFVA